MTTKTIEEIFAERTCGHFAPKAIPAPLLQEMYDLMKLGPTSANCCPLRIVFVQSQDEKAKLQACAMQGNVQRIGDAPVTAIFAYDTKFYEKMDVLFAHNPGMGKMLEDNQAMASEYMMRNSTLQAAYFMIIARAKGLGCGPMSGFDGEAVNKTFFAGTDHKVNFICTLGYRSQDEEHPRLPRLDFSEACKIV